MNARMSPRSFARLRRLGARAQNSPREVSYFAVQEEGYADRYRQLGVANEKLIVTGSVKYDGAVGERDTARTSALRSLLGLPVLSASRPHPFTPSPLIWLAGSTHAPEESIILDVFARLRDRFPQLRLILVPRHPDRFEEVARLIAKTGLAFARRSPAAPLRMPSVVLLDTVANSRPPGARRWVWAAASTECAAGEA